jgi:predicted nucleic acid-binding protein
VTVRVVDASAAVALLFDETTREGVVARLRGFSLRAPALIEFEVANACLKKIRAAPSERRALLEAFSLFAALSIALEPIDLGAAVALAESAKLSLYDAGYLWLARALDAELVTLDERLARAHEGLRGAT